MAERSLRGMSIGAKSLESPICNPVFTVSTAPISNFPFNCTCAMISPSLRKIYEKPPMLQYNGQIFHILLYCFLSRQSGSLI